MEIAPFSLLLLLLCSSLVSSISISTSLERERQGAIQEAYEQLVRATSTWAASSMSSVFVNGTEDIAVHECLNLYEDSVWRIQRLTMGGYDMSDAATWISGAMTAHSLCRDLMGGGLNQSEGGGGGLRETLTKALSMHIQEKFDKLPQKQYNISTANFGLLEEWNPTIKADMVVAQDGSGNYKTINEALTTLSHWNQTSNNRVTIYIKSGTYREYIEINSNMRKLFFVGDGIDKTIITGNRNVPDGFTTFGSATFGVLGDEFWARDITFENTAGPSKQQAVSLRVGSDKSVFYHCSFKGYQDTLFLVSQRQFFRGCQIYGTIDFIFGNAAVVIQNCDIYVRKPMPHQGNMITAQGRDDPNQNTGISIHACRIKPSPELQPVKSSYRTYLGRPWKKYARTIIMKSDLDGMITKEGWARWAGNFAINTLYYAEFMNTGDGAGTRGRVRWPGFHLIKNPFDADPFTISKFIDGATWLPESGVPFWNGV